MNQDDPPRLCACGRPSKHPSGWCGEAPPNCLNNMLPRPAATAPARTRAVRRTAYENGVRAGLERAATRCQELAQEHMQAFDPRDHGPQGQEMAARARGAEACASAIWFMASECGAPTPAGADR